MSRDGKEGVNTLFSLGGGKRTRSVRAVRGREAIERGEGEREEMEKIAIKHISLTRAKRKGK